MNRLFNIKSGDMLTIAGRRFVVNYAEGVGWERVVVLSTDRLYMSKTGPTNQIRCTLDELLMKLITVHKRINTKA